MNYLPSVTRSPVDLPLCVVCGLSAVRRCSPWPQLGRAPQQWVSLPRLPGRPVGRKEQGSDGFAGRRTLRAMKL